MSDTTHLVALMDNMSRQQKRLENTVDKNSRLTYEVLINQLQREIESEFEFLSIPKLENTKEVSDEDLLKSLYS